MATLGNIILFQNPNLVLKAFAIFQDGHAAAERSDEILQITSCPDRMVNDKIYRWPKGPTNTDFLSSLKKFH